MVDWPDTPGERDAYLRGQKEKPVGMLCDLYLRHMKAFQAEEMHR